MMRSVWSFWSKPYVYDRHSAWLSHKHHLLSWVLSVETAKCHYPDTWLITDDAGTRMLVDGLGLTFEHLSTELESLNQCHPVWWCLGKLYAYRAQSEPFVHIDSDVYMWNRLPADLEAADVLAQNPEFFSLDDGTWYRPKACVEAIHYRCGWLPEEWLWYVHRRGDKALCCGIYGGRDLDLIQYAAGLGIRCVEDDKNRDGWRRLGGNQTDNLLVEQYLINACIEYRNSRQKDPSDHVNIRYLFESPEAAFNPVHARSAGFTHLIAGAKRNKALADRLERRVRSDYPARYDACLKYIKDYGGSPCV
jgi:hypothetical protein